ncbi:MAG TPA: hypothetical protein VF954_02645, partial [Acidimicrobiales bacterium]
MASAGSRAAAARRLDPDWVRPHSWEQGDGGRAERTVIGNLGSGRHATVDGRGLVTAWQDGWSLDWWVRAEDRWHLPSRQAAVRQRLVEATPVVETAMRIPGGDAVERAYAVAPPMGPGRAAGELVVVEVDNQSPVPVAVAFALRPYHPDGLAVVHRVTLEDRTVLVDGLPALFLPRPPAQMAASTFGAGDVAGPVLAGEAGHGWPNGLRCRVGLATAAFVFPVPHRTTIRVAVPLSAERRARRRVSAPLDVASLPASDAVVRGWVAQTRRGMSVVLPPGR